MSKYKCCLMGTFRNFREEIPNIDWWETDEIYDDGYRSAAESFAEHVFNNKDGWEYGDYWDDDISIVIKDEKENYYLYEIEIEHIPYFRSVKPSKKILEDFNNILKENQAT